MEQTFQAARSNLKTSIMTKKDSRRGEVFVPVTLEMMEGRCIDPMQDWAFKRLFSIEKFLISLLNGLLRFQDDDIITHIDYAPQENQSLEEHGRICRFDIVCTTQKNENIHIEVQNAHEDYFEDRMLYYSALSIDKQGKRGEWDYHLHPHYAIAICGFSLHENAEELDKYAFYYRLREEDNTHDVLTDALTVIIVELDRFMKTDSECTTILKKWLYLLRNMHNLKPKEIEDMFGDEILREFVDEAAFARLSPDEKISYIKAINDEGARRCRLRREREEGERIGLEKGREEGRAEGLAEGEFAGKKIMARNLLLAGIDIDIIKQSSGLSDEVLRELMQ